jgi:hypothetical protein
MQSLPRDVAQLIIEKLDRRHISIAEAIAHAARYGATIKRGTRESVAKQIGLASLPPAELGRVATTCLETAYGTTTRLSFQIKVF